MSHFWISLRNTSNKDFITTAPGDGVDAVPSTKPNAIASRATYLIWDGDRAPTPADGSTKAAAWAQKVIDASKAGALPGTAGLDIVFVVHGYNNSVEDAYKLHRRVESELNRPDRHPCIVISYDWPSGTETLAYLIDAHTAKITALSLVTEGIRLLAKMSTPDCKINFHVVAHSMGTYVVQRAFKDALDSNIADATWSIGQVALLGADLSSDSLLPGDSASFGLYRFAARITNYYSGYDEVLWVSGAKRLGLEPRAGRVGVPTPTPDKLIDMNCSEHYGRLDDAALAALKARMPANATVCHSWYFYDDRVMDDLAFVLKGKIDRNVIPTRTLDDGINSFKLR